MRSITPSLLAATPLGRVHQRTPSSTWARPVSSREEPGLQGHSARARERPLHSLRNEFFWLNFMRSSRAYIGVVVKYQSDSCFIGRLFCFRVTVQYVFSTEKNKHVENNIVYFTFYFFQNLYCIFF